MNIIVVETEKEIMEHIKEYPNMFRCVDCEDIVMYKNNIPTPQHFIEGLCLTCGRKTDRFLAVEINKSLTTSN